LSDKKTKLKRDEVVDWFGSKAAFEKFHKDNLADLDDDLEFL